MKSRRAGITALMTILMGACSSAFSDITVLTFDDFTDSGLAWLSNGYGGFDWENFKVLDNVLKFNNIQSGYFYGRASGDYVAFNSGGGRAMLYSDPFDFIGTYLTAAWRNNLRIQVKGYLDDTLIHSRSVTVDWMEPTWFEFNFTNIDRLEFYSYGGTHAPELSGRGNQFAMDNFTYVPEPGTLLLLGLGGTTLLRKRRQA